MDYTVEKEYGGTDVKRILFSALGLSHASVTRLKKLPGGILLDGEEVTVRAPVREGQVLSLALEDRAEDHNPRIAPLEIEPDILYEDENCFAVNKPAGMPTIPTHGHRDDTLANVFAYYAQKRGQPFVFRPVNRLDRETSGAVLLARTKSSAAALGAAMAAGAIKKKYVAILRGSPDGLSGEISGYVVRRGDSIITRELKSGGGASEFSLTRWRRICGDGEYTVVEAEPVTGRTHQLRVHFASVGAPIAGDGLYGDGDLSLCGRLALHAHTLTFPANGSTVTVTAPVPEEIEKAISRIKEKDNG